MTYPTPKATSRRRFLKTSGAMVAMIPVVNLMGCSDDGPEPPPAPREPPVQPEQPQQPAAPGGTRAEAPAQGEPARSAPAGNMPKVSEDEPTARALAYVHDANDVDASQQPRYEEGQLCDNCALYIDESSDEEDWGGCSIFPGKLVNAKGWCNAYVPVS